MTKTYTYGLQRISENQLSGSTWTPTFYGYDGHGNVRFTTSTAGAVGNTYQFDAFGAPIANTGTITNTYLYSGERFDSNLNLYQLRARYYNMLTGRFETMDPAPGTITDPATLHKYVYTRNNPANLIDPTGRDDLFEEVFILQRRLLRTSLAQLGLSTCIYKLEYDVTKAISDSSFSNVGILPVDVSGCIGAAVAAGFFEGSL